LVQPGINIENGKTYKVSFEASAANTRTIEVEIASNLHNSSIYPYIGKSQLYMTLGDMESAIRYSDKALEISPDDAEVHNNKGKILGILECLMKQSALF